jgi:glucose-1-phosphate thymidylyltransferase
VLTPLGEGLAQAFIIGADFVGSGPSALVLGDNIFFGHGLPEILARADAQDTGGSVFGYHVADPERYGVAAFDADGRVTSIVEKPKVAPSSFAITGLYFLDGRAPELAASVKPSARGELEIVDLLERYRAEGTLQVERMGRGFAWLDTGTPGSLLDAGNFVRTLQDRQGMQVGSPDEIAFRQGWIDRAGLAERAKVFAKSSYGASLEAVLKE